MTFTFTCNCKCQGCKKLLKTLLKTTIHLDFPTMSFFLYYAFSRAKDDSDNVENQQ